MPSRDIPGLFAATVRASAKKTYAGKKNAMSAFLSAGAKTLAKCTVCGNPTVKGSQLCTDHASLEKVIAAEKEAAMERLGGEYNMLESACRSCQGNITREVLCTNLYIGCGDGLM